MMESLTSNRRVSHRRLFWWACCAASVTLLIAMSAPLLVGHTYVADDLGEFHLPARAFYAECLANGHDFDWWPDLYGGVYLTGEGQAGTYHPVHLVLYRVLPLQLAFGLEVWLCYPFMLCGTYLWLRRRLRRRHAALFGALVFTFCGFNLLHLVHVNAVAVVSHIPWLLWLLDIALVDRRHRRVAWALMGIALLTGSQILLGYPQYVWYSALAQALYVIVSSKRNALTPVVGALLTGLIIGSVQWLPTVESLNNSVRQAADQSFAVWGSLHPLNFMQLLAPYLFQHRVVGQNTHELGLYIGAAPMALVAWLILRHNGSLNLKRLKSYGLLLGVFAALLALGCYGFLYPIQTWLPVVGKFRFPCRSIVLFHLAVAILAAIAATVLIRGSSSGHRGSTRNKHLCRHRACPGGKTFLHHEVKPAKWIWSLPVASLMISVAATFLWPQHVAAWWLVLSGPALFAIAAWLIRNAELGRAWAVVGIVLFAAADLGVYGLSYSVVSRTESLEAFADSAARPPGDPGRVAVDLRARDRETEQIGNRILLTGFHRVGGYLGLVPQRQLDYHDPQVLRIAGTDWIATGTSSRPEDLRFHRVAAPLPAVRMVSRVERWERPQDGVANVDVGETAVVQQSLELPASQPGSVTQISAAPGAMHYRTDAPDRQLLVVAQNFHRGWHVTVDDRCASVWRVYGDFMGCVVPGGDHDVQFDFRPASRETGRSLTLCGLGLMLCGFLATLERVRQS